MIAGWLVGMIYILVIQSEVCRPDPSSTPSGSLLEMQDLRAHPDLLHQNPQVICKAQ